MRADASFPLADHICRHTHCASRHDYLDRSRLVRVHHEVNKPREQDRRVVVNYTVQSLAEPHTVHSHRLSGKQF